MSCGLEGRNKMEREGLQELRRRRGKLGILGAGSEVWDHEDILLGWELRLISLLICCQ